MKKKTFYHYYYVVLQSRVFLSRIFFSVLRDVSPNLLIFTFRVQLFIDCSDMLKKMFPNFEKKSSFIVTRF